MFNWFRKPADPMQEVQGDPRTEDALDKVARKFKNQADLWKRVASNTDRLRIEAVAERDAARAELARLKAGRERSNANLAAANAARRAKAKNAA